MTERARERSRSASSLAWPLAGTYLPMVLFALAAFLIFRDVVDRGEAAPESTAPPTIDASYGPRRDENIRFFESRVLETRDSLSYNTLAGLYLQRYRETGDVNDIGRAERAATLANEVAAGNYGSIISLASVKLVQHDFVAAETLARDAIARRPGVPDGYAILGDALFALGQYEGAGDAYAIVLEEAPGPAAFARQAAFAEARGNLDLAEQFWRAAAGAESENAENAAWARVQLGTLLFNTGDLDAAGDEFERALAAFESYPHALAGLARVAAARGDLDRSAALYALVASRSPEPGYLAAHGDVLAAAGRTAEAGAQYRLVAAIRQLQAANGIDDDLAIVQFEVDHEPVTPETVERARAAYERRPSVEAADTFAWALYRAGEVEAARAAMQDALRQGTRLPQLMFHAAAIAHAGGDIDAAASYLDSLDALNPEFSVLYLPEIDSLRAALREGDR